MRKSVKTPYDSEDIRLIGQAKKIAGRMLLPLALYLTAPWGRNGGMKREKQCNQCMIQQVTLRSGGT